MKKTIFVLFGVVMLVFACTKDSITNSTNSSTRKTSSDPTNGFSSSIYADYYDHYMSEQYGDLNFAAATYVNDLETNQQVLTIPSFNTVSTGSSETPTVPVATLRAVSLGEGKWYTNVQLLDNANFVNGEVTGFVDLSLVNGFKYGRIDHLGKLQDGLDHIDEPPVPNWWSCTTTCFQRAKDACGSQPTCNFLCSLVDLPSGQCTLSMALACGIWCSGQVPPPPSVGSSNLGM